MISDLEFGKNLQPSFFLRYILTGFFRNVKEIGGSNLSTVLFTTLAATTILPTSSALSFLLKYSASVRKTDLVIRDEFETSSKSKRFCGRVREAVEDVTEEKSKLFSSSSKSSENGLPPKETLKTCVSNTSGLTSWIDTANESCGKMIGPVWFSGMGIFVVTICTASNSLIYNIPGKTEMNNYVYILG